MALTRNVKELVQKRMASDPAFGEALLSERIDTMMVKIFRLEKVPEKSESNLTPAPGTTAE